MLANRAPELASHYNMSLEPQQITAEEVLNLVRPHLKCNTAYNPEHSVRGKPTPEVINTTSTANSHCHYQGTTNILKGQTLVFIQIEIMVIHIIVYLVNTIHPVLLGIPITQVII